MSSGEKIFNHQAPFAVAVCGPGIDRYSAHWTLRKVRHQLPESTTRIYASNNGMIFYETGRTLRIQQGVSLRAPDLPDGVHAVSLVR